MKVYQETTDWGKAGVVNHIYFLSDSKDRMYAYINLEGKIDEVKTPYRFYTKGRTFKEIANRWGFSPREKLESVGETHRVPGSRGAVYTVTNDRGAWTCTCSGFKFRGQCRHVESLKLPASLCG
jgi:hypothetical protein